MRVFLIGFMGSGKSTIGKKLATKAGLKFIDLDNEIENLMGFSIQDAFALKGEEFFREQEVKALKRCLNENDALISVGGGTPCFGENIQLMLNAGVVIYLKMTKKDLNHRLSQNRGNRPLLLSLNENELEAYINTTLDNRENYYNLADITVSGKDFNAKKYNELTEQIQNYVK